MSNSLRDAVGQARNRMEDVLDALAEVRARRPNDAPLLAIYERAQQLDSDMWSALQKVLSDAA